MKITILGAGSMACALASHLCKKGNKVVLWTKFKEEADIIEKFSENPDKLPGIKLIGDFSCETNINKAIQNIDALVIALPSQTIRESLASIENFDINTPIICCSKGIDAKTKKTMAEVIEEETKNKKVVILSGPSHAEEFAKGIPTALVAGSNDKKAAKFVQELFMSSTFRVYTSQDVVGVELGGAIKNVIALCAGISDGLGFGDNTKAALMTRGMAEIIRLGVALGAKKETLSGLSGMGDLIVTCTSVHSRNRRAGILIGEGLTAAEAQVKIGMVVEGITSLKPIYELSKELNIEMPITEKAYEIIFKDKNPAEAVYELMTRMPKEE